MGSFVDYLKHPLQLISIFAMVLLGVFLIIASKKMRISEKSYYWTVSSLVIGLMIIFELGGGNIFGGISAEILSIAGGTLGLYFSISQKKSF